MTAAAAIYGRTPYGPGTYGAGGAGVVGVSLLSAVAISTREVRVLFNEQPQNVSPLRPGDALNVSSWQLQRRDTSQPFTVMAVDRESSTQYVLRVLEAFGPWQVVHRVSVANLRTPVGDLINPPRIADFAGVTATSLSTAAYLLARRNLAPEDLRSEQQPAGAESLGGVLVITAGGDYATESGVALVRKLVLRRLITPRGGFFHLPDYGLGLPYKLPVSAGEVPQLQAEIERQVRLEPEVQDCRASVTSRGNVLIVQLQVRLQKNAGDVVVPFRVEPGVVIFL